MLLTPCEQDFFIHPDIPRPSPVKPQNWLLVHAKEQTNGGNSVAHVSKTGLAVEDAQSRHGPRPPKPPQLEPSSPSFSLPGTAAWPHMINSSFFPFFSNNLLFSMETLLPLSNVAIKSRIEAIFSACPFVLFPKPTTSSIQFAREVIMESSL